MIECIERNHPVRTSNKTILNKQHFVKIGFYSVSKWHTIKTSVLPCALQLFYHRLGVSLNILLQSIADMERCTDNRSTTPPLSTNMKLKENGKPIASYAKGDQVDTIRSKAKSSSADDTLHVSSIPRSSKSRFVFRYLHFFTLFICQTENRSRLFLSHSVNGLVFFRLHINYNILILSFLCVICIA